MTGLMIPPTDLSGSAPEPPEDPFDMTPETGRLSRLRRPATKGRPAKQDKKGRKDRKDAPAPAAKNDKRRARGGNRQVTPSEASVNLLSPWVIEENHVASLRRRFVILAVGLVALVILVFAGLHLEIRSSESALRDDEAAAARLRTKIAEMAPVRAYSSSIQQRDTLVNDTMASDVTFSRSLKYLEKALPEGVEIAQLSGTSIDPDATTDTSDTAATCPGPDPFGTVTIVGCLQFSGFAPNREAVSELVQALSSSKYFVEPFVTTTDKDEVGVKFDGSVGLDPRLLSGRYLSAEDEEIAAADGGDATAKGNGRARKAAQATPDSSTDASTDTSTDTGVTQ